MFLKEIIISKDTKRLKMKGREKIFHENNKQKRARMDIRILDKIH